MRPGIAQAHPKARGGGEGAPWLGQRWHSRAPKAQGAPLALALLASCAVYIYLIYISYRRVLALLIHTAFPVHLSFALAVLALMPRVYQSSPDSSSEESEPISDLYIFLAPGEVFSLLDFVCWVDCQPSSLRAWFLRSAFTAA